MDSQVIFIPSGLAGTFHSKQTVLDAARELGVDLDSVCGARGVCGKCQVIPSFGNFPKWAITSEVSSLSEVNSTEELYSGRRPLEIGGRLGCQAFIQGDLIIEVPPGSQLHGPMVRKEVNLRAVDLDPVSTVSVVEIDISHVSDPLERKEVLSAALLYQWEAEPAGMSDYALKQLGDLDEHETIVSVVLRHTLKSSKVVAIWAGFETESYGIAIDVGSTTIAGHLLELSTGEICASHGLMNPQIRLGEDLMSRVSYAMMNPDGGTELTGLVRGAINDLVGELAASAKIPLNKIVELILVGNPVMHHLVLGLDSTPLGQAPFTLQVAESVLAEATSLELVCEAAYVYVLPCIAGHVGADTAAVILAEDPINFDGSLLIVDVGTNAEIVLSVDGELSAASSPTGPALEGAQITCGQRASKGAIERVRINRETLEPKFKVIGSDLWSDDPLFDEDIKAFGITGICGSGIVEVLGEMYLAGLIAEDGLLSDVPSGMGLETSRVFQEGRTFSYMLHRGSESSHNRDIIVNQSDVRAVQLAKAALRAGVDLLMERAQLTSVKQIRFAGGFGSHIDPLYAMILGLIPDCPLSDVVSSGNAAGAGAIIALVSGQARTQIEKQVLEINKIETAIEPRFQELFVAALAIPHLEASTANLATEVTLPPKVKTQVSKRSSRRSRQKD
jgi:uncharacterized 2Fe-2S/4Fe-4S cluster protein (DUF4445 family)|tara:strand:+ start:33963 stop:35987 length:2025 start_codon:yes stop_codon:yes gene_type:complete